MMRLKKVIFSLILSPFFMGCFSNGQALNPSEKRVKILSMTAQIGELIEKIGGERIDQKILIYGDLDPHSYEIVKGDAEKIHNADLIFFNGRGLEHGASLSSILKNSDNAIAIGDLVDQGKILKKGPVSDPHIWMDISLWSQGVDPVVEVLSKKDPEGALYYKERGMLLKQELIKSHEDLKTLLHKVPSKKRYLVTSHDAFHYFTRAYLAADGEINWEDRFRAPEGLAPEGQLNPRDIQKIIDFLREKGISVIFPESNASKDSLRKIASSGKEFGLKIQVCKEPLYGDSLSGKKYLDAMEHNGKTIERHLSNMQ